MRQEGWSLCFSSKFWFRNYEVETYFLCHNHRKHGRPSFPKMPSFDKWTSTNLQSSVYCKLKLQGAGQDNQRQNCQCLARRIRVWLYKESIDLICVQDSYKFFWMIKAYKGQLPLGVISVSACKFWRWNIIFCTLLCCLCNLREIKECCCSGNFVNITNFFWLA